MLEIDRFIEALLKRPCCRMIDTEKFISVKPIFQLLHIDTECLSYNNSKRTINFDQMRLYSSKIYCQSLISNRDQYFKRVWEFSRSLLHITAYSTANRNWSDFVVGSIIGFMTCACVHVFRFYTTTMNRCNICSKQTFRSTLEGAWFQHVLTHGPSNSEDNGCSHASLCSHLLPKTSAMQSLQPLNGSDD